MLWNYFTDWAITYIMPDLSAPFPWFGGKSKVAADIWQALGDVDHYVDPFVGSMAALLGRPEKHRGSIETVNDIDRYICVDPKTEILDNKLHWRKAEQISIGDKLLGFDEFNPGESRPGFHAPTAYRKWKITEVLAVKRLIKPCYKLIFDDGTQIVCSSDHLWLGGSHLTGGRGWRWIKTENMAVRSNQRSWVLKLSPKEKLMDDYDHGWLGGFADGEGSVLADVGSRLTLTQKEGQILNKATSLLSNNDFNYSIINSHHDIKSIQIRGGLKGVLSFLMKTRPERLIDNFIRQITSRSIYGRNHQAVGLIEKVFVGDQEVISIETDCHTYIAEGLASHNCNFWRALQHAPDEVAHFANNPANEADLTARHIWLVNSGAERIAKIEGDPDYYDAKVAGWWVWGICSWIGGSWCAGDGPWGSVDGKLVNLRDDEHSSNTGRGVNRQLIHLSDAGQGVNRVSLRGRGVKRQRVHLGSTGQGINRVSLRSSTCHGTATGEEEIAQYLNRLAERLRYVRVCCGDWQRVVTPGALAHGNVVGIFLDPPYDIEIRAEGLYNTDGEHGSISVAVRDWCIANQDNPRYRIVLAGYEGEHDLPGWRVLKWKARRAYGNAHGETDNSANRMLERLWLSPNCLMPDKIRQGELF
jgi:hypothetical protein